jgi:hypothetical protein
VDEETKLAKPIAVELDAEPDAHWWPNGKDFDGWLTDDTDAEVIVDEALMAPLPTEADYLKQRLEWIKESHELLKQFTPRELKALLTLKRNTSPKAWTLREDLLVLTMSASNKEIADQLKDRNKEAVKKRLQLLKSKGLSKRQMESEAETAEA